MYKVLIWIVFVLLLLIAAVKCQKPPSEEATPEKVVAISEEIVVNPTAVSLTTTIDEYIALSSAILFAHDDAVLSEDGKAIIDERIAKYRGKVKNTMDIEIIGYTDNTGEETYNKDLSLQRAQVVADYIELQTDIPHTEIKVIGKGSSEVQLVDGTEESQALERRVDIHFMGVLLQ